MLRLRRKVSGPDHVETLLAEGALGNALANAQRFADAIVVLEPSLTTQRRSAAAEPSEFFWSPFKLMAKLYERVGRDSEAKALRDELTTLTAKAADVKPAK